MELALNSSKAVKAIGFDCEWTQTQGNRRPVALMQLATHTGLCVLLRLNFMKSEIPSSLKELLEDNEIMKVGVSPDIDAKYLFQDHNIEVNGWVDLRHLAVRNTEKNEYAKTIKEKLGLEALAFKYLGKKLNKDWRVRGGNWEASKLSRIQVNYAAEDALTGIQVLICMLKQLWRPRTYYWPPFRLYQWEKITSAAVQELCFPLSEIKFLQKGNVDCTNWKKRDDLPVPKMKPSKEARLAYSVRKSPLYHNSQLWAPDGEHLCTCDPRKAIWYVEKKLGELVSEDPLVVKLKFEPAGRPNREGLDGQFYLQERFNLCVVCGKDNSYIRKNIIPHEYRKHFPKILKSHQSHDVVLLCTDCHQMSNIKDNSLRYTLAKEFDAPIGFETDVKLTVDGKLKAIRSAAGALLKSRDRLPEARIAHLERLLKEFFGTETLTDEHITEAAEMNVQVMNKEYVPHGYKVYLHYRRVGLIQLEQRWRQWFLDSMQPKYLPENWSVRHNHKKLQAKMARYPPDSKVREDYKLSLVGTEGTIDVPYIYNKDARHSTFFGLNSDDDSNSRENTPEATS